MGEDRFGNPVSASDPATRAAIDDFVLGFLGYNKRIVRILAAADRDEDCLANAYAGLLWMLSELGDVPPEARRHLARAEAAAARATEREKTVAAILRRWIENDLPGAQRETEALLQQHPRDLAMLKLHQYHDFNAGDFAAMLRIALASRDAAADVGFLHGMIAFGYEQCHLLDKAEASARRSLGIDPQDPWAQHALAHVMLTQGRIDEGAAFLESVRGSWNDLTSFMYTHHWWHLALFYLSQGREADALAAYDDHCWSMQRDFSQDQIGAVSLLARFGFAGIDVGDRWRELGPYLLNRVSDVGNPFLCLQYLYGLARGERPEAAQLLRAVRERADADPLWRDVVSPLAQGLVSHASGDGETALPFLDGAIGRLAEIGGSHAQRDLFEQILLDCLIGTGRLVRAQQLLEQRRSFDPDGVPLNRQLADVYNRLELFEPADEARSRAEQTLARTAARAA